MTSKQVPFLPSLSRANLLRQFINHQVLTEVLGSEPLGPKVFTQPHANFRSKNASVLNLSRFWASANSLGLIITTGLGITWLALAKTEEAVAAPRKLESIGAVKAIRLPVEGVVSGILVKEGQRVTAGQPLLQMDTEATNDRCMSLECGIALKQGELALKEDKRRKYLDLNLTEQNSLQSNLELETEVMRRLEGLTKDGGIGEIQYLTQRNKVQEIDGRLDLVRVDRLRQTSILNQNIQNLRSELNELRSSPTEVRANTRYQSVNSPVAGVVFVLKPTNPGFSAQTNEPV